MKKTHGIKFAIQQVEVPLGEHVIPSFKQLEIEESYIQIMVVACGETKYRWSEFIHMACEIHAGNLSMLLDTSSGTGADDARPTHKKKKIRETRPARGIMCGTTSVWVKEASDEDQLAENQLCRPI